jgi:hypothetical protein
MLVFEVKAALLPLVLPGKAVLSCAPGTFAMVCQAGQTSPLGWVVRPLAAGSPLVACHEYHAIACQGCPSCGGPLTVRRPRTRTANPRLPLVRKACAPREATQELHCHRTAGARSLARRTQLRVCRSTSRAVHGAAGVMIRSKITEKAAAYAPAMHLKTTPAAPNPSFKRTAPGVPVSAA